MIVKNITMLIWANPPIPKWEWSVACSAVHGTLLQPLLRLCFQLMVSLSGICIGLTLEDGGSSPP